jgi:hypothetical protein
VVPVAAPTALHVPAPKTAVESIPVLPPAAEAAPPERPRKKKKKKKRLGKGKKKDLPASSARVTEAVDDLLADSPEPAAPPKPEPAPAKPAPLVRPPAVRVDPLKAFHDAKASRVEAARSAPKKADDEDNDEPRIPKKVKVAAAALAALVLLYGISHLFGSGRPRVYPVQGKVFFEERPVAGASVSLDPTWEPDPGFPRPHALVKDDGSFVLETFGKEDGAPSGEYRVAVTWYEKTQGEDLPTRNQLPKKYAAFHTSGLTVKVAAGTNQIEPLRLSR